MSRLLSSGLVWFLLIVAGIFFVTNVENDKERRHREAIKEDDRLYELQLEAEEIESQRLWSEIVFLSDYDSYYHCSPYCAGISKEHPDGEYVCDAESPSCQPCPLCAFHLKPDIYYRIYRKYPD